jgi:hypothetical protein
MSQTLEYAEPTLANPLGEIDSSLFRARFNQRPFKIKHNLVDHPLFALPRLVELAQRLPESRVEYNSGNLPVSQDPTSTPRTGLSIEETIRRIEECRSWLVLKNVELDGEYRELLDACLDAIEVHTRPHWPGMCLREGFVFISSPGSVTPFHIDPENNFLLQIRGTKQVELFDATDRNVVPEKDLEAFFSGAHRNLVYKDEFKSRGELFNLIPGEGLHFPVAAPHWVKNGPAVSISFSITFQTEDSRRRHALHRLNAQLRRWGLTPSPFGVSPSRDALKYQVVKAVRAAKQLAGRGDASKTTYGGM